MGDTVIFETRQDFRAWLSENCRTHQGVGLLFGKAGGGEKRLLWLTDRLDKNLRPMEKEK